MSEPTRALLQAATQALKPHVADLRRRGWAVEVVAQADPLKVTLEIDLAGLKTPVESPPEPVGRHVEYADEGPHDAMYEDQERRARGPSSLRDVLDTGITDRYELDPMILVESVADWAYGAEGVCNNPTHNLPLPADCPACHGTGKVRRGGLVDRFSDSIDTLTLWKPEDMVPACLDALRAELGDPNV